jgi:hypothetical protein
MSITLDIILLASYLTTVDKMYTIICLQRGPDQVRENAGIVALALSTMSHVGDKPLKRPSNSALGNNEYIADIVYMTWVN